MCIRAVHSTRLILPTATFGDGALGSTGSVMIIDTISEPGAVSFPEAGTMNFPGLSAGYRLKVPRRTGAAPSRSKNTSNVRPYRLGLFTALTSTSTNRARFNEPAVAERLWRILGCSRSRYCTVARVAAVLEAAPQLDPKIRIRKVPSDPVIYGPRMSGPTAQDAPTAAQHSQ